MIRYYREWLSCHGWGVMLSYDTVMAWSKNHAAENKPAGMYDADKSFEVIKRVKKEHLHLSDRELGELYGYQEGTS